jgi:hypothetical protein
LLVCATVGLLAAGFVLGPDAASAAVPTGHSPFGHLAPVHVARSVAQLTGTAIDPDTTAPIKVTVKMDGQAQLTVTARKFDATVAQRHPHYGGHHDFDVHLPIPNGRHHVCVIARNVGRGHDVLFRCVTVTGRNNPVGAITGATHTPAGVTLTGWALDPNTATPVRVAIGVDGGRPVGATAELPVTLPTAWQSYGPRHGFSVTVPTDRFAHKACVTVSNRGAGTDSALGCRTLPVIITAPSVPLNLTMGSTTSSITLGWVAPTDDGGDPLTGYRVSGTGITAQILPAATTGETLTGLEPATDYHLSIAAINAIGTGPAVTGKVRTAGARPTAPQHLTATSTTSGVTLRWTAPASDGDLPVTGYRITRRGAAAINTAAGATSAAITHLRPAVTYRFSVSAVNIVGASVPATVSLKTAGSVPSVPRNLRASGSGSTAITLRWTGPANAGDGLHVTGYRIKRHGVRTITRSAGARSATITGLKAKTTYRFSLTAVNVLGSSPEATVTVTTGKAIRLQTTPAPVSTSHYLRNLTGSARHDRAELRAMGAFDAAHNPSGHRYLVLLHMGGQYRGGAVLSATTRWISYSAQVTAVKAYIDGYVSRRKANAPVLIAVSTNNDGAVSRAAGRTWANSVVDPIARHAARYHGVAVAGGNDMEPGFYAGPRASRAWLSGYLSATGRKFVFVGSADGCPLSSRGRCNNGWTTRDLHYLSAGAAPHRIISMPQIYNTAMPLQWRNISADGAHKVNFGGPLTEWTACAQAHSCYSQPNVSAWRLLFDALASNRRTRMVALPYGTDLRIN